MRTNLRQNGSVHFCVFSNDQCEQIALAACEVIERTGTRVLSEEARQLLAANGAYLEGDLARIPAGLIGEMLACVPPRTVIGNRNEERTLILESHRVYYGTGSDCPFILDAKTGARRQFVTKDISVGLAALVLRERLHATYVVGLILIVGGAFVQLHLKTPPAPRASRADSTESATD